MTRFAALWLLVTACGSTVDSVGDDCGVPIEAGSATLRRLSRPATYPNAFRDVLGKTPVEIRTKVDESFDQLFHGLAATEAIYFLVGDDQAYIQDVLHGDVRSEGMGLGMLIAVQLDKRDEFDRLWRYASAALEYASGPNRGYFRSSCDNGTEQVPCADPFGHQSLVMALLLAHGRWTSESGDIDYGSEARRLLDVMLYKEQENCGIVEGVTNVFDEDEMLAFDVPNAAARGRTRPSVVMPGYYDRWAEATGESFWSQAAERGRAHLEAAAHPETGLLPLKAEFDGTPVPGFASYGPESYRAPLNMAIDFIWSGAHPWYTTEADRLLGFFSALPVGTVCLSYTLEGECLSPFPGGGLDAANGALGLAATIEARRTFIEAVWNRELPTGSTRYYDGMLHLLALLILSGELQIY